VKRYFYKLLARYIRLLVRPDDSLASIDPPPGAFSHDEVAAHTVSIADAERGLEEDFLLLNGTLHYERDIQVYLSRLQGGMSSRARLIVVYYSALWRPLLGLATRLGWRTRTPEQNWLAHGDVINFLHLADFEVIRLEPKVLLPVYVPLVSELVNRYLAPLPLFSMFCLANVLVARRRAGEERSSAPSVSVVVAARNEAGNIQAIVDRLPRMGPDDELIFVEGGSSDGTWERIREVQQHHTGTRILAAQQDGKGKGDAVRKGFAMATRDILMILDADLTVPPEDLPKFYRAIAAGKGEFVSGSRLVYPMEAGAMRFLNLLANKFFAAAFSFVLGQRFKDTLCGTKVISRANYERLARHRAYFGDFDPFGDFDLIFGAARMGLRIIEIPITYRERTYGETNISRWRHGALLIAMLVFAARRLKFV
jgi:GT2 family glycosyltransferase